MVVPPDLNSFAASDLITSSDAEERNKSVGDLFPTKGEHAPHHDLPDYEAGKNVVWEHVAEYGHCTALSNTHTTP